MMWALHSVVINEQIETRRAFKKRARKFSSIVDDPEENLSAGRFITTTHSPFLTQVISCAHTSTRTRDNANRIYESVRLSSMLVVAKRFCTDFMSTVTSSIFSNSDSGAARVTSGIAFKSESELDLDRTDSDGVRHEEVEKASAFFTKLFHDLCIGTTDDELSPLVAATQGLAAADIVRHRKLRKDKQQSTDSYRIRTIMESYAAVPCALLTAFAWTKVSEDAKKVRIKNMDELEYYLNLQNKPITSCVLGFLKSRPLGDVKMFSHPRIRTVQTLKCPANANKETLIKAVCETFKSTLINRDIEVVCQLPPGSLNDVFHPRQCAMYCDIVVRKPENEGSAARNALKDVDLQQQRAHTDVRSVWQAGLIGAASFLGDVIFKPFTSLSLKD